VAKGALTPYSAYIFGNCPIGHVDGSVFFYNGEIVWLEAMKIPEASKMHLKEFAWLTREELIDKLSKKVCFVCCVFFLLKNKSCRLPRLRTKC
jgi:hypothetical protein